MSKIVVSRQNVQTRDEFVLIVNDHALFVESAVIPRIQIPERLKRLR